MIYTNKLNLPKSFLNYVNSEEAHDVIENRFGVKELLRSTRELLLIRKYKNKIQKDISECIPALFGTAVHSVLENNTDDNIEKEYKLEVNINKYTIVGKLDFLDREKSLIGDYKTCSVSKVQKEDFDDWKMQGVLYAYLLYKKENIIINNIEFYALMKDWSKIKLSKSKDYPKSPIYVYKYKLNDSDYDFIETWLIQKLQDIELSIELPLCSDEERWYSGDKYAVYKKAGDKRAAIVCDTEIEAHGYITNVLGGSGEIEFRKGESTKCKYYCDVKEFCSQYKEECK